MVRSGATDAALPHDCPTDVLWSGFAASRQHHLRERLIEHYLPLARAAAARLYALRSDDSVSFEDYLQYARVGLVEAIDRYDPSREASFETFSGYRIRGAILNGLGKESEWAAQRDYWPPERLESLKPQVFRGAEDPELEDFVQLTVDLALGFLLELDVEHLVDSSVPANPYAATELAQLRDLTRRLVETLPERERDIIRHHYFEDREFQVIAQELQLTKGRVSQLHAQALGRIRQMLRDAPDLDRRV